MGFRDFCARVVRVQVLVWACFCGVLRAEATHNLVEIKSINPTIMFDIRYATADNFTGKVLYPSARCLAVEPVAWALDAVQKQLALTGLGLKVFDAYRPLSVQWYMWNSFPDLHAYIGNPAIGGKHNRGAAVDLTLIDLATGQELEMPSGYDDLSERAHRDYDRMTPAACANCHLLEDLMAAAGFEPLPHEWWHFNWHAWAEYPLLDISADSI
jgi:zinc D-Ala-D-Ala dipeptidase